MLTVHRRQVGIGTERITGTQWTLSYRHNPIGSADSHILCKVIGKRQIVALGQADASVGSNGGACRAGCREPHW